MLEGPDGSGTTVHSKRLTEALKAAGHRVMPTMEPSDGPIGAKIRDFLQSGGLPADALQILFCADRADHIQRVVLPALERGEMVVCDRYILSTLAYGTAATLNLSWLESLNTNFIQPAVQILLLPPLSVCLERIQKRSSADSMEHPEFQERVHSAYANIAKQKNISVIDTSGPEEESATTILKTVLQAL